MLSLSGRIATISGVDAARALPGVTHIFTRHRPRDEVQFPRNNVEKCLNIIIAADSAEAFWRTARAARSLIDIRLEPGDERTCAFLFGADGRGLAMAYPPPTDLTAWIDALPPAHPIPPPPLSALTDWHGIPLDEALRLICAEYALAPESDALNRPFWRAFLKGGLQAGRFFFDTLDRGRDALHIWVNRWDGILSG